MSVSRNPLATAPPEGIEWEVNISRYRCGRRESNIEKRMFIYVSFWKVRMLRERIKEGE